LLDQNVPLQPEQDYLERALAEYQSLTGDFQLLADYPVELQDAIRRRARQIQTESEEKSKQASHFSKAS
jgi:hypothetical protein